ncbi:MAG: hypothetical protein M1132_13230 [Chloroflexi bacterium]|nr:hypothetical protein [Chloroflexota bacterium]
MDSSPRGTFRYDDEEIKTLLAQARALQYEGDAVAAASLYRAALVFIPADDPFRAQLESTVEHRESEQRGEPPHRPEAILEEPVRVPWWMLGMFGCTGLIALGLFGLAALAFVTANATATSSCVGAPQPDSATDVRHRDTADHHALYTSCAYNSNRARSDAHSRSYSSRGADDQR